MVILQSFQITSVLQISFFIASLHLYTGCPEVSCTNPACPARSAVLLWVDDRVHVILTVRKSAPPLLGTVPHTSPRRIPCIHSATPSLGHVNDANSTSNGKSTRTTAPRRRSSLSSFAFIVGRARLNCSHY